MENIKRTILADNLETVEFKLAKLAKRAVKLQIPVPYLFKGTPYAKEVSRVQPDGSAKTRTAWFIDVELANPAVIIPGWSLVAALDHAENTVRVVPEATLPTRYRGATNACDHCKISRKRNSTYVLRHEDGRFVQVGSGCVCDFLGHDADRAVRLGEFSLTLGEILDDGETFESGHRSKFTSLADVLTATVNAITVEGWWSRKAVNEGRAKSATADTVAWLMDPPERDRDTVCKKFPYSEAYGAKAVLATAWAASLTDQQVESSDYLYNLRQIAQNGFTTSKSFGVAVSMIAAFDREMGLQIERAKAADSVHFGTIGERGVYTLTITRLTVIEGQYGTTTLYSFIDQNGNHAKWFSSGAGLDVKATPEEFQAKVDELMAANSLGRSLDEAKAHVEQFYEYRPASVGDTVIVNATIKAHGEYKGIKQTSLGRVAIYVEKVKKTRKPSAKKVAASEALSV